MKTKFIILIATIITILSFSLITCSSPDSASSAKYDTQIKELQNRISVLESSVSAANTVAVISLIGLIVVLIFFILLLMPKIKSLFNMIFRPSEHKSNGRNN